jgi:hypothetical protein
MRRIHCIGLIIGTLLLTSCEENVVLDLGTITKKLVVEAKISNDSPVATVALSYSQDFYDTPDFQLLTNGSVSITSDDGQSETLTTGVDSIYYSKSLIPVSGKNYTLKVKVDNQDIEVTTQLPQPVQMASITFIQNPLRKNQDSLCAMVTVVDPPDEVNFYRLKVHKLHKKTPGEYYLMDDTYTANGTIPMPVYYRNFGLGDTVVVELDNLTKSLYQYYSTLSDNISGSFNSIAPGNPVSNMPDNVYGYFGAYGVDRDTVIVRKLAF